MAIPITNTSTPATNFPTVTPATTLPTMNFNTPAGPNLPATPAPVSSAILTPAQMAANRASLVAGSNGTLKEVNGQVVPANSTLGNLASVPPSDKTKPSSSATVLNGLAGVNAVNGTTASVPTPTDPNVDLANYWTNKLNLSQYGLSITADDIKNSGGIDQAITTAQNLKAEKQTQIDKQNDLNAQAQKTASDLAANDSELAAATAKLNLQMANLAKMGMVKTGDESQSFNGMSSTQYVTSESNFMLNQLIANANAKAAAIRSGDAQAVAQINANYEKIVSEGTAKLASDLAGENQNSATLKANEQSRADTLALNTQTKNQTIADKELQTIPSALADQLLALPTDTSKMTPAQMAILTGTPGYNSLITAGMSPNDALGYVKSAATSNKQQLAQDKLSIQNASAILSNTLKQGKIYDQQIHQNDINSLASVGGGIFATAVAQANLHNVYSKQQSTTGLSNLASFAQTGDLPNLKSGLAGYVLASNTGDADTYNGLASIAGTLQGLKTDLAKVDPSFVNGSLVSIAAKVGIKYDPNNLDTTKIDPKANITDPNLRSIGQELAHIVPFYAKMIGGVRGAASAVGGNASAFASLVPNIKENSDLLLSDILGFTNTAEDLTNSAVTARITQPVFDKIYGTDGVFGSGGITGGGSSPTVQSNGQTYTVGQVYSDGTSNWTVDASGAWSKQ